MPVSEQPTLWVSSSPLAQRTRPLSLFEECPGTPADPARQATGRTASAPMAVTPGDSLSARYSMSSSPCTFLPTALHPRSLDLADLFALGVHNSSDRTVHRILSHGPPLVMTEQRRTVSRFCSFNQSLQRQHFLGFLRRPDPYTFCGASLRAGEAEVGADSGGRQQ